VPVEHPEQAQGRKLTPRFAARARCSARPIRNTRAQKDGRSCGKW